MSVNFSPIYVIFIITAAFAVFAWTARDSLKYFFRPKGGKAAQQTDEPERDEPEQQ